MRIQSVACAFVLLLSIACADCRCLRQSSLSIEAKIIYNMGGPQPVARTRFYLLDINPFSIRADEPSFQKKINAANSSKK